MDKKGRKQAVIKIVYLGVNQQHLSSPLTTEGSNGGLLLDEVTIFINFDACTADSDVRQELNDTSRVETYAAEYIVQQNTHLDKINI